MKRKKLEENAQLEKWLVWVPVELWLSVLADGSTFLAERCVSRCIFLFFRFPSGRERCVGVRIC